MSALTYLNSASATPASGTYTISSATFGTASADRLIAVVINWIGGTGGTYGCTIGGVTATQIALTENLGESIGTAIFIAAVPTGTSGNIVFTNSAGNWTRAITSWWGLTGYNVSPFDTKTTQGSSASPSVSIAIPANGAVIGGGANQGGSGANSAAWTGLTEKTDSNPAGFTSGSNASDTFVSASGGTTVSPTWSPNTTGGSTLAVASFSVVATGPTNVKTIDGLTAH